MGFITAGVAIAAATAAAVAKKKASDKASKAREEALNGLELLDIPALDDAAKLADKSSYEGRLKLQRDADPLSAEARATGLRGLTENVDTPNDAKALSYVDRIAEGADDPALEKLRQSLILDAQEAIEAGATIPADVQAELVRAGLETAGAGGLPADRQGASGQTLRRMTGAAGLALKQQRAAQAGQQAQVAASLQQTRANILGSLIPQIQTITMGKSARADAAFRAGASQTPEAYGLTGSDVTNLGVENTKMQNYKTLGLGDVRAQKALAQGDMTSSIIGSVGTAAAGGLGAYAKSLDDSWLKRWGI